MPRCSSNETKRQNGMNLKVRLNLLQLKLGQGLGGKLCLSSRFGHDDSAMSYDTDTDPHGMASKMVYPLPRSVRILGIVFSPTKRSKVRATELDSLCSTTKLSTASRTDGKLQVLSCESLVNASNRYQEKPPAGFVWFAGTVCKDILGRGTCF